MGHALIKKKHTHTHTHTHIYIYIYIYIYITRLASNQIFSQSNKIHREESRAKDLSAPRYKERMWCCCDRNLEGYDELRM